MGSDGSKGPGFLKGLFIGSIIGAITAFFLSQKDRSVSLKSRISGLADKGKETVAEAIREGKEAAARKEAEIRGETGKKDDD